jgi:phage-related protein
VLTEVKAYSSWRSAPVLLLDDNGRAETDLVQIRNIDGLDPVKASVSTSPYGSIDGASYTGSSVLARNIVLTVRPNPDWDIWSHETLRKLIYAYFMPKKPTRLVFHSDDMNPVEISGIVESAEINQFSKDPEFVISVICPDPYFTSVDPIVLTGQTVRDGGAVVLVDYQGTIESGMIVKVTAVTAPNPTQIGIQIGNPVISYFNIAAGVDNTKYFEMSSLPMKKFVQNIDIGSGVITNLLSQATMQEGSDWPLLQPGENEFSIVTDQGVQDWELTYYERFGGL